MSPYRQASKPKTRGMFRDWSFGDALLALGLVGVGAGVATYVLSRQAKKAEHKTGLGGHRASFGQEPLLLPHAHEIFLPPAPPSSGLAVHYLDHLREASQAAAAINTVRPAAIAANVPELLNAPYDAVVALGVLGRPIDTLTVQRDLNLLGATPPLPETGELDGRTVDAIKAFQTQFKQPATGTVDQPTAIALRYSVGVVNFQNQLQGA